MTIGGPRGRSLPPALERIRLVSHLVRQAEFSNHATLAGLPSPLQSVLRENPRFTGRVYRLLERQWGPATGSSAAVAAFFSLPAARLQRMALGIGLGHALRRLGQAQPGTVLQALAERYGTEALDDALACLAGAPAPETEHIPAQGEEAATVRSLESPQVLIANGWTMIRLWAIAKGANPAWRIPPSALSDASLTVIERDIALGLVETAFAPLHAETAQP